jgi:replicative DNA helicase Mcm
MVHTTNQELVDKFEEFYRQYYSDEVAELARQYPRDSKSLHLDWRDLYQMDPDLADDLLNHPDQLIEAAEEALRLYDLPVDVSLGMAHVRVTNLSESTSFSELDSGSLNKLVSLTGTVDTAYSSESVPIRAVFVCQRCGAQTEVPQGTGDLQEPTKCVSCERQSSFDLDTKRTEYVDRQLFELRESPIGDKVGQDIESIMVIIEDDIAGEVEPGDQLTVVGTVRPTESDEYTSASIADKRIEGSSIQNADILEEISVTEDDEDRISDLAASDDVFEQVVESIAPAIYGNRDIKEALALQLFGGVPKDLPNGSRIRGNIHILVVGDPGLAKTRLLQSASNIAPKALKTNGKRTTSAGLTTAATRTSEGTSAWELKAGPVVLADHGHLAIDDLDKMHEEDRAALHEPMEEQTVTASKGDANEVLDARTSITAAANPKYGTFDQYESIGGQVDLDPGLISRFDLIFARSDNPDAEEDAKLASHLLESSEAGERRTRSQHTGEESVANFSDDIEPRIEIDLLRKYIAYARQNCFPTLTDEAKETLEEFYVEVRSHGEEEDAPVPVSIRQLEALVRLAEASARVRLSDEVTTEDANRATELVSGALGDLGIDPEAGDFDADVVETGTSKTRRERIESVVDIVENIENEFEDGAPIKEVVSHAEEQGLSADHVKNQIEQLRDQGELYEPNPDHLRSI